jgi:hypothetical protein
VFFFRGGALLGAINVGGAPVGPGTHALRPHAPHTPGVGFEGDQAAGGEWIILQEGGIILLRPELAQQRGMVFSVQIQPAGLAPRVEAVAVHAARRKGQCDAQRLSGQQMAARRSF